MYGRGVWPAFFAALELVARFVAYLLVGVLASFQPLFIGTDLIRLRPPHCRPTICFVWIRGPSSEFFCLFKMLSGGFLWLVVLPLQVAFLVVVLNIYSRAAFTELNDRLLRSARIGP